MFKLKKVSHCLAVLYQVLDIYSLQLLFLLRDTLLFTKIQNTAQRFENPSEKYVDTLKVIRRHIF